MHFLRETAGFLAGIVLLYAFWPYLKTTAQGKTTPRRATWLVWAVGDWVALAGQFQQRAVSWLLVGAVIGATVTFIFSLIHGEAGWKMRDTVCIALSLSAIMLWVALGDSNYGIGFSLLALLIAAWPTWEEAWRDPGSEDLASWVIFTTSSALAVVGIPELSFAAAAPPIVFLVIDGVTLALAARGRPSTITVRQ